MKCSRCGKDIPDDSFFCGACGAPVSPHMEDRNPDRITPPVQEKGVTDENSAPEALPRPRSKLLVVMVIVVSALVLTGVAAGVLLWRSAVSESTLCDIKGIELTTSSGNAVNLSNVPLGVALTARVRCSVRFGSGGSGRLEFVVLDGNGDRVWRRFVRVSPGEGVQVYETEFIITESEGERFKLLVNLTTRDKAKSFKRSRSLSFYVEKGKAVESSIEGMRTQALQMLLKAEARVQNLLEKGMDVDDLAGMISTAEENLESATTKGEIEELINLAERIIGECDKREVAFSGDEEKKKEACRKNQADLRSKLIEYYAKEGNFPDNLSELGNVPECPSGGMYEYIAPDTTPDSLRVSCSVHGSL